MYFCLNVFAGKEEKVLILAENLLEDMLEESCEILFARKENIERRQGIREIKQHPLFPGYLFLKWNGTDERLFPFREIERISGVIKFLRYNGGRHSLIENDEKFAAWIFSNNGTIGISKVFLKEGQKIHIVQGPLTGFDGNIVKVDRHHKRITLRFNVAGIVNDVNFTVEFIEQNQTLRDLASN